jgi:hypothetical protein
METRKRTRAYRFSGAVRPSLRNGFTAYVVLSPAIGLSCHRRLRKSLPERNGIRYLVGVKTRNKYTARGTLNPTYNIRKKGANVTAIAERRKAHLAWVAIQVAPERRVFWAYFGTIAQIEDRGERFSIPMRAFITPKYERLADQEADATIPAEWSNGGFGLSRDRPIDF